MSLSIDFQGTGKLTVRDTLFPSDERKDGDNTFAIIRIERPDCGNLSIYMDSPAELDKLAIAAHRLAHQFRTQLAAEAAVRDAKHKAGEPQPMNMMELAQAIASTPL